MGIPVGKLALYTACAGIPPRHCLPVMLDVGTNNTTLLDDEFYIGYPRRRVSGPAYFALVDEFVRAVQKKYPDALIQFEDFLTPDAYALLNTYRDRVLCFNDDIQGTAAVALAGVYASTRITERPFRDLRIMFLGAGSAATGIADLMVSALADRGPQPSEARRRLWFVDVNGLVVRGPDGSDAAQPSVRARSSAARLRRRHRRAQAERAHRRHRRARDVHPGGRRAHVRVQRTSRSVRAFESYLAGGMHARAGLRVEPRPGRLRQRQPVRHGDVSGSRVPPGTGQQRLRVSRHRARGIVCRARRIPDEFFLAAARTLAGLVTTRDLGDGSLYPPLRDIRRISLAIAVSVAETAYKQNSPERRRPRNLKNAIARFMYKP